jgi:DNA-directed RNA polymerase subunit L
MHIEKSDKIELESRFNCHVDNNMYSTFRFVNCTLGFCSAIRRIALTELEVQAFDTKVLINTSQYADQVLIKTRLNLIPILQDEPIINDTLLDDTSKEDVFGKIDREFDENPSHYIGEELYKPITNTTDDIMIIYASHIKSINNTNNVIHNDVQGIPILTLNPQESILIHLRIISGYGKNHAQFTMGNVIYEIKHMHDEQDEQKIDDADDVNDEQKADDVTLITMESYYRMSPQNIYVSSMYKCINKLQKIYDSISTFQDGKSYDSIYFEYIHITDDTDKHFACKIKNETHTMGNLLQHEVQTRLSKYLLNVELYECIVYYNQPMLNVNEIIFNFEYLGDEKLQHTPKETTLNIIQDIIADVNKFIKL